MATELGRVPIPTTGEAYLRLNKLSEAEHWYRESLRAKPDHVPAHLTYGKLLALTVMPLHYRPHPQINYPSLIITWIFSRDKATEWIREN